MLEFPFQEVTSASSHLNVFQQPGAKVVGQLRAAHLLGCVEQLDGICLTTVVLLSQFGAGHERSVTAADLKEFQK